MSLKKCTEEKWKSRFHLILKFIKLFYSNLPHDVVEKLCELLNPPMMRKDYRSLAGKMKFSHREVRNIDLKANPTEELLGLWVTGEGSKTVSDLIELLIRIERYDAIRLLREYEYTGKVLIKV